MVAWFNAGSMVHDQWWLHCSLMVAWFVDGCIVWWWLHGSMMVPWLSDCCMVWWWLYCSVMVALFSDGCTVQWWLHGCNVLTIRAFLGQNLSVIAGNQTDKPIVTVIYKDLISDEKRSSRVCEAFSQERAGLCTNRIKLYHHISKHHQQSCALPQCLEVILHTAFSTIHFSTYSPIGFEQSRFNYDCICDRRLQMFTNMCNINCQTLLQTDEMNFTASYCMKVLRAILLPSVPTELLLQRESPNQLEQSWWAV